MSREEAEKLAETPPTGRPAPASLHVQPARSFISQYALSNLIPGRSFPCVEI